MAKKNKGKEEDVAPEEVAELDQDTEPQAFDPGAIATIEAQQARLAFVENAYRGLQAEHANLQVSNDARVEDVSHAVDLIDGLKADVERLEEEVEQWQERCKREQNARDSGSNRIEQLKTDRIRYQELYETARNDNAMLRNRASGPFVIRQRSLSALFQRRPHDDEGRPAPAPRKTNRRQLTGAVSLGRRGRTREPEPEAST